MNCAIRAQSGLLERKCRNSLQIMDQSFPWYNMLILKVLLRDVLLRLRKCVGIVYDL